MREEHIANTTFRYHGAGQLLSYIDHAERPIKNRAGLEMEDEDIQNFIDKSDRHEFEREVMFTPRDENMTDDQLEEATRDSIQDYFDGSTVDFCYAVHRDKPEKGPDVHVALTGDIDDLYMNQSDIDDLRSISRPTFKEKSQTIEKTLREENDLDQKQAYEEQQEKQQKQTRDRSRRRRRDQETEEEEEEEEENENEYEQ